MIPAHLHGSLGEPTKIKVGERPAMNLETVCLDLPVRWFTNGLALIRFTGDTGNYFRNHSGAFYDNPENHVSGYAAEGYSTLLGTIEITEAEAQVMIGRKQTNK